jgi:hypothetical protein
MNFPHRLQGWWSYLGLTLASALLAHLIFDAIESGLAAIVTRPIHLVYGAIVLAVLCAATLEIVRARGADLRRRNALRWSSLRLGGARLMAATIAVQGMLAATMFALEGGAVDGTRLVVAALCALLAIVVGTFVLRSVHRRVAHFVAGTFAARRPPSLPITSLRPGAIYAAHPIDDPYYLFRANRPPPSFV